jgi:hypothetical protein
MRRIVLTLPFVLLSLAFAPAPFTKAERRPETERQRAMRECHDRLEALGVRWRLEYRQGGSVLFYSLRASDVAQKGETSTDASGDVLAALRRVARYAKQIRDFENRLDLR